jgi:hypothetical protein
MDEAAPPGEYGSDTVHNVDAWCRDLRGRPRWQALREVRRSRPDRVTPSENMENPAYVEC